MPRYREKPPVVRIENPFKQYGDEMCLISQGIWLSIEMLAMNSMPDAAAVLIAASSLTEKECFWCWQQSGTISKDIGKALAMTFE